MKQLPPFRYLLLRVCTDEIMQAGTPSMNDLTNVFTKACVKLYQLRNLHVCKISPVLPDELTIHHDLEILLSLFQVKTH